jgi:hypothetical protein
MRCIGQYQNLTSRLKIPWGRDREDLFSRHNGFRVCLVPNSCHIAVKVLGAAGTCRYIPNTSVRFPVDRPLLSVTCCGHCDSLGLAIPIQTRCCWSLEAIWKLIPSDAANYFPNNTDCNLKGPQKRQRALRTRRSTHPVLPGIETASLLMETSHGSVIDTRKSPCMLPGERKCHQW